MTLRQNDGVAMTEQQLDVQASEELSDAQMEGVAGGVEESGTERHLSNGFATWRESVRLIRPVERLGGGLGRGTDGTN